MYKDILSIHFELTDKCNAACPQCARTNYKTSDPNSWIGNVELTIEDIKNAFDEKFFNQYNLQSVRFCGNFGDPIIASDIFEITKFFVDKKCEVIVVTNGSLRNEQWWKEYGMLLNGTPHRVEFALDGATQTVYEIYRQKCNLEKALSNARVFSSMGGKAVWKYVIFDHNQHEIELAKEKAKDNGFSHFYSVYSSRNAASNIVKFEYKDRKQNKKEISAPFPTPKANDKIQCKAIAKQEIYVGAEGNVYPCCWLGSKYDTAFKKRKYLGIDISTEYNDYDYFMCNLKDVPISDILEEKFFKKTIPESFETTPKHQCVRYCKEKIKNYTKEVVEL